MVVDIFVDYDQAHETDWSLMIIFFVFPLGQEANAAQTCTETVAASEVDRQFATFVVNSYARDLSYGLRIATIKGMENSIYSSPFV